VAQDPWTLLRATEGFQWDEGNREKNWARHQVREGECEEVFFNAPLLVVADVAHSSSETRYYALGVTDEGRRLFVAFTLRDALIRVISARDMNRRERMEYERARQ
jgi:uncharacterized protein